MYAFGAGTLLGAMTLDASGNAPTVPTWVEFGTLQQVQIDIQFESKTLYGAKTFPAAIGRGKGTLEAKAKTADITGRIFGDLVFGNGSAAGVRQMATTAPTPIPSPSGPYTITPTPPGSGTWVEDMGVRDAATGAPLARVSSAPTAGEYSVSSGTYTFASADAGSNVIISYIYTTATGGHRGTITSGLMGYTPQFRAVLQNTYGGKTITLDLVRCVSSQFSLPFQNDDFSINDFNFAAMANDADLVGNWSVSE